MNLNNILTPEQRAELERLALERGCTVAELVWTALDQYVVREGNGLN